MVLFRECLETIQRMELDGNKKYGSHGASESSNLYKKPITWKDVSNIMFGFGFMLLVVSYAFLNKQTEGIILSYYSPR